MFFWDMRVADEGIAAHVVVAHPDVSRLALDGDLESIHKHLEPSLHLQPVGSAITLMGLLQ